MDLKKKGKTEKTFNQSYKVLIITKTERWKCHTGRELKGSKNKFNKAFKEMEG